MKVLWLINITLPCISEKFNLKKSHSGGWMVATANAFQRFKNYELTVCFPFREPDSVSGQIVSLEYFGFSSKETDPTKYNIHLEEEFLDLLKRNKPEIIHIWGTEYPHTLAMVKAAELAGMMDKVVISIQGLCSVYAHHYLSGIPTRTQNSWTLRDLLKKDNIVRQQGKFAKRGKFEIEALQKAYHIIGRTIWDKACSRQINPNATYHFCNETLRDGFYEQQWDLRNCEKHSIFMSNGSYPIKGLHFMLEAMAFITKMSPQAHLLIAGRDITRSESLKDKIRISSYDSYIKNLISKYNLSSYITFLGALTEKEMVYQYIKSHVFVSPSTIENSPNSVGEAMLLGVPTVASNVGGVGDMLVHNQEGFTYQHDAPYMLAYYVCKIFGNDELALKLSKNARQHALKTHDKEKNLLSLLRIYEKVAS